MTPSRFRRSQGSTLVVTISVVATLLALLASAVQYTAHVSRMSARNRKSALAMEIADGHLETLFTNWRNIFRNTWTTSTQSGTDNSVLPTNYFFTDNYNPGPAPTPNTSTGANPPPVIPLPAKTNFPTEPNYTVGQYRIQAVTPMIELDATENSTIGTSTTPPAAYGPNTWQYSYFYLASVDVSVPVLSGVVTAKVRRVFEKKFDNPWTYGVFYADDLEVNPGSALTLDGPIHTNSSLYIGTSNFTAQNRVEYGGVYVNGYSPNDTYHTDPVTVPAFLSGVVPSQESPYLPFGWNLNTSGANQNSESYRELIERPVAGVTDPVADYRFYNQAGLRILIDQNNNVTVRNSTDTIINSSSSSSNDRNMYSTVISALSTGDTLYDHREGNYIRIQTLDISKITTAVNNFTFFFNGVIYIADTSAGTDVTTSLAGVSGTTKERGIRLKNGTKLPWNGLTVASENPVYIQGDYNTGGTPPSDSGTFTSPTVSGYTRKNAAIIADAIDLLSGAWVDVNSPSTTLHNAQNTTVNAALVSGNVPSGNGNYSGGIENFVRFLEDWSGDTFTYYGSMVELWQSKQGNGAWNGTGSVYKAPARHWYYETNFGNTAPPGSLQIAAYLQQQRWYQVY